MHQIQISILISKVPWPYFPVLLPTPLKLNFYCAYTIFIEGFSKVVTTLLFIDPPKGGEG